MSRHEKPRRWVSVSPKNHKWLKKNGNLDRNHRSYDSIIGDLIKFYVENAGRIPMPK